MSHVVILHNQVGDFKKGQVVPVDAFPMGFNPQAHIALGSVRVAKENELNFTSISLDEADVERVDKEIHALKEQVIALQQENLDLKGDNIKLQQLKAINGDDPTKAAAFAKALKEKEAKITEQAGKLADLDAEKTKLAAEVQELREQIELLTNPVQLTNTEQK